METTPHGQGFEVLDTEARYSLLRAFVPSTLETVPLREALVAVIRTGHLEGSYNHREITQRYVYKKITTEDHSTWLILKAFPSGQVTWTIGNWDWITWPSVRWLQGEHAMVPLMKLAGAAIMLQRPSQGATGQPAGKILAAQCGIMKPYENVWEYLTQETWPDGSPRQTATLAISMSEGRMLLTLRDRANNRITFASGPTVTEALGQLDMSVGSEDCTWRKDNYVPKKGR